MSEKSKKAYQWLLEIFDDYGPIWLYHPVYASIISWHGSVITDSMRRHSNFDFPDSPCPPGPRVQITRQVSGI